MSKDEAIKQRLDMLVKEIRALYAYIDSDKPELPPDAAEKLSQGICLKCGKRITKDERRKSKRGNHDKCYRQNQRRVKDGRVADDDLVRQGIWAPVGAKGIGRPRKDAGGNSPDTKQPQSPSL